MTNEEWKTIRQLPGPWAEIGSDKLILTVPSEAIRDYEDPQGLSVVAKTLRPGHSP